MNNLPSWVPRVQSIWFAIGALITVLAAQGLDIPTELTQIFAEEVWNALIAATSATISFVQIVRAIFSKPAEGEVQVLSASQKWAYIVNPFKVNLT